MACICVRYLRAFCPSASATTTRRCSSSRRFRCGSRIFPPSRQLQFSVLPGFEDDWSLVQVALTDITARKKAEAYLEFLGKPDVLTKLYNRSFYVDELNRLERKGPFPVTIIMSASSSMTTTTSGISSRGSGVSGVSVNGLASGLPDFLPSATFAL